MKKVLCFILATIFMFSCMTFSISAISSSSNTKIISLENGYYITVTMEEINISRATNTKTGIKNLNIYDSDNNLCVVAKIEGTFTYTGSSSTCTAASITYNIYNDDWKMKSATASKSSNQAVGNITAKRYTLGIPVQTVEKTFYLTCSATGKLS